MKRNKKRAEENKRRIKDALSGAMTKQNGEAGKWKCGNGLTINTNRSIFWIVILGNITAWAWNRWESGSTNRKWRARFCFFSCRFLLIFQCRRRRGTITAFSGSLFSIGDDISQRGANFHSPSFSLREHCSCFFLTAARALQKKPTEQHALTIVDTRATCLSKVECGVNSTYLKVHWLSMSSSSLLHCIHSFIQHRHVVAKSKADKRGKKRPEIK